MANHSLQLQIPHPIQMGKVDIELPIKKDGKLLGTLKASQGGIDWIPANSRTRYVLSWTELGTLVKANGAPSPK